MLEDHRLARSAKRFTLQWHVTHACDLHCKHCYDRTKIAALKLDQAVRVLDQLEAFARQHDVGAGVCFSGGNPFLYRPFLDLYQAAADRGLGLSILGNPVDDEALDRLCAIRKPRYFQVSLEGLPEHNDSIRGQGFFDRVMEFLPKLRERKIQSVIMTTLTAANCDEVIPLSRLLKGEVDRYAFNRLAPVGEGAALASVEREPYGRFMIDWLKERTKNKSLVTKDNLFNIYQDALNRPLFGGCTGFGCGAAFNFVALLPDGEVHACRKFPSPIGNVLDETLTEIYASKRADRYRRGCEGCDGCAIRHRCGGCLAVSHGLGLDELRERDPHCFMFD